MGMLDELPIRLYNGHQNNIFLVHFSRAIAISLEMRCWVQQHCEMKRPLSACTPASSAAVAVVSSIASVTRHSFSPVHFSMINCNCARWACACWVVIPRFSFAYDLHFNHRFALCRSALKLSVRRIKAPLLLPPPLQLPLLLSFPR